MLFLGLNLTIIGLVEFTGNLVRVVVGFVGLILGIGLVYAVSFLVMEWRQLRTSSTAQHPEKPPQRKRVGPVARADPLLDSRSISSTGEAGRRR